MPRSRLSAAAVRRLIAFTGFALFLAVADGTLQAQTTGATASIRWTAPGDDGTSGRASRYDIRYSANTISGTDTLGWWNAATVVSTAGKVPALPGARDSMAVTGLTAGMRYYVIVRTGDEVPNWSPYSNLAILDLRNLIVPGRIADVRLR